jgi:hypothetical protein
LTCRELVWMVKARRKADWSKLSSLMAHLANLQRADKRSRVWLPEDFDPYRGKVRKPHIPVAPKTFVLGLGQMMGRPTRPCPF